MNSQKELDLKYLQNIKLVNLNMIKYEYIFYLYVQ